MAVIQSSRDPVTREDSTLPLSQSLLASASSLFAQPSDEIESLKRLEAEKVHLIYTQASPVAHVVMAIGAMLFVLLLWPVIPQSRLLIWFVCMSAIIANRWLLAHYYRRTPPRTPLDVEWWRTVLFFSVGLSGLGWGAAGFFLFPSTSFPHQVLLLILLGGASLLSVAVLATIRTLFFLFFFSLAVPTFLRLWLSSEEGSGMMGILGLGFSVCLLPVANYMHTSIIDSLRLRFTNLDLIRSLSVANKQAEQARLELAASHAALSKSEERFRLLVEQAADVVTILNADGTIRYISPSVEPWLGYSPETLINTQLQTLLHPSDQHQLHLSIQTLMHGTAKKHTFEARWQHQTGAWRIVDSVMRDFLDDETVKGITLSSRDITARKEVERLKDELVSTVSHELRTPLTSLLGFTELMLTREFSVAQQRHFLTIMYDETTRLRDLINDFLDLQRIESGQQAYVFTSVDPSVLLRDAVTLFANGNNLHTFQLDVSEPLPPVRLDADRIRQVLTNLFSNAVKFSPNGGKILVRALKKGQILEISVTDEGVGIPAEVLPQLFHKFFRADSTETRKIRGTGLGLALVKQIVEAHDGQVGVTSQLGKGSTFSFSLPMNT